MGVTLEWSYQTGSNVHSSPAVADLDGDGTMEVLVGSSDDKFYCLSHTGAEEWNYTIGGGVRSSFDPLIAVLGCVTVVVSTGRSEYGAGDSYVLPLDEGSDRRSV